jgi:hypothetical protein
MINFTEYKSAREDYEVLSEIMSFEQEILLLNEACKGKKTHPGKEEKSEVLKRAKRGENVFGGGFQKLAKKAGKRYKNKERGERVAAAIMWKKGKHITKEDIDNLLWIIEDDLDIILDNATSEENLLLEKWSKKVKIEKTGEHAGKSVSQLKKEIEHLRGKSGNKEQMGELLFALRAKGHWKHGEGVAKLPKKD